MSKTILDSRSKLYIMSKSNKCSIAASLHVTFLIVWWGVVCAAVNNATDSWSSVVSLSPSKAPIVSLRKKLLSSLLGMGWSQEKIPVLFYNKVKINWDPLSYVKLAPLLNKVRNKNLQLSIKHIFSIYINSYV